MEAQNLLKKTLFAGIGAYSLTKEKAEVLVANLIEKGESSQNAGSKFMSDVVQKATEEAGNLKKEVDSQIQKAMSVIRPSYEEEFKKLNQRIDKLSREVQKLKKQSN